MTVYLDCNATTPVDSRVAESMSTYLTEEFGNAGSRTHDYGARAKKAVERARRRVAEVLRTGEGGLQSEEVIFTSGATEANNIAILGLETHGRQTGRKHVVTTQIEHPAVLEPVEQLEARGFEVDYVEPTAGGWVEPGRVVEAVREDTVLVSVMQVNNETGVRQPVGEIAESLEGTDVFLHVDAAQGFGKELEPLRHERIDMISASAHKIYGPKGIGALVMRRRNFRLPPLEPLVFGGGQERGLRPGTLPVQLIVGFGKACELAVQECDQRRKACRVFRLEALKAMESLVPRFNGDPDRCLPHVLNVAFDGVDQEALTVGLKDVVAISNGSACTSSEENRYSHVLEAMGAPDSVLEGSVRLSWCHMTEQPDWKEVVDRIGMLR